MKKSTMMLGCMLVTHLISGQPVAPEYHSLVRKADSLYNKKEYQASASLYSAAFKVNGWKGMTGDRYNAACSWALAGTADSSFIQLDRVAKKGNWTNYAHLVTDPDLQSLHSDARWQPLLEIVKQNKERAEVNFNKPLVNLLDSINTEDQKYRLMIGDVEKKHGNESAEMIDLWKTIRKKDSANLIKVTAILDQYGWLGPDVVGEQGNTTLFLVIQHADQKTQEKYLPVMRVAVKNGKAYGRHLALLEDRVALAQGKKQIYGSQVHRDQQTGKYFVAPIEDEPNVNKRRAAVGLDPLEDYAKNWDIEYKLPTK